MLKKIITTFLLFTIFIPFVFADTTIELSTDKLSVPVNEDFTLNVKIKNDWSKDLNVESITWIENFNKVSQKSIFNSSNINWVANVETSLQFVLNWINPWEYSLGPVVISDWKNKFSSNVVKITIKNGLLKNNWIWKKSDWHKDDINPVKKINLLSKNFLYSPSFIFILIILFISGYLLIKDQKKEKEVIESNPDKIEIIKDELSKLKNEIDNIEKNIFYSKLNIIFRNYFEHIWIVWANWLTLKELGTKQIDNELFELFKKSYSKEFSNNSDTKISRKKIIEHFEEILSK